jgi:hypothetical protein
MREKIQKILNKIKLKGEDYYRKHKRKDEEFINS